MNIINKSITEKADALVKETEAILEPIKKAIVTIDSKLDKVFNLKVDLKVEKEKIEKALWDLEKQDSSLSGYKEKLEELLK